jgi:hypothetical protein
LCPFVDEAIVYSRVSLGKRHLATCRPLVSIYVDIEIELSRVAQNLGRKITPVHSLLAFAHLAYPSGRWMTGVEVGTTPFRRYDDAGPLDWRKGYEHLGYEHLGYERLAMSIWAMGIWAMGK